ncbi:alkaline phosphatase family protein [Chloroflexota bacterium]
MSSRVLMIGLDGATFDLIDPWVSDGGSHGASRSSLPHLARLMGSGAWGRLRSTVPPATFPAWTSLMTGVNPGRHGVFDFTRRVPGTYRIEFINATHRLQSTIWQLLSQCDQRVAVIGMPATYPPEAVNGVCISGFDSPVATGIDRSFVHPPELYDEIREAVGPYEITDFQETQIGPAWHENAQRKMLHALSRRTAIASYLLDRESWDCFFVHYGESDTVAHHFWAFHDSDSPRYKEQEAEHWGRAIQTIYQALDKAIGQLLRDAGPGATVLIVSDHGSGGAGQHVIHLNRWLATHGWLSFAPRSAVERAATGVKRVGLALPSQLQEFAFRGPLRRAVSGLESSARLGGIDWQGTQAFSEEVNTFPAIWLNVKGRDPGGTVEPGDCYEALREEILAGLMSWQNPATGQMIAHRAWRREELYEGDAVEYAPDIVVEPALDQGFSYTFLSSDGRAGPALRTLTESERLGAKGGSMNGSHRPDGILLLSGAGVRAAVRLAGCHITDVAPTLLQLLGTPLPEGLDGRVLSEALLDGDRTTTFTPAGNLDLPPEPYTDEQAERLGRRLRGLGYRP